jgi:hypothetical protein
VATTAQNLEFGVNSESDSSYIGVKQGSDDDLKDILFQVQGIFGCRILRIDPAHFVTNGGTIEGTYYSGDYTKDAFTVVSNDTNKGTVAVSPAPVNGEYAKGTTLTLTATAKTGFKFVKWTGAVESTEAEVQVVTSGQPQAAVAIFEEA